MQEGASSEVGRAITGPSSGRYRIEKPLGQSNFAVTYLALDQQENRPCVLKRLSLRHIDTFKARELFEREAKILANLDHPRIPKFLDYFTEDSSEGTNVYLVQEFIAGKNLAELVHDKKHFTEEQVAALALSAAEVLQYLQSFSPPIIHRDIKPSNLILNPDGQLYLIDFGAVRDKILHEPLLQPEGPTIVGSYGYMPLEQFEGRATPASDIYSLGATLIYLLSHKEPWEMEKDAMRIDFHPHVSVSPRFADIVKKMIDPDHKKRYQTAAKLKEALLLYSHPPSIVNRPLPRMAMIAGAVILAAAAVMWIAGKSTVSKLLPSTSTIRSSVVDPVPPGIIVRLGSAKMRHGQAVRSVAFSPDRKLIASGSDDETVSLWDAATGAELHRWKFWGAVSTVIFSPDGKRVAASGGSHTTIRIWDVESGNPIMRLQGALRTTTGSPFRYPIAYSPDGKILAATSSLISIQLWDARSGKPLEVMPGTGGKIDYLFFSEDQKTLFSINAEGVVSVWDFASKKITTSYKLRSHVSFAVSPDGKSIACGGYSGVTVYEALTGKKLFSLGARDSVSGLTFSPDSKLLAVGSGSKVAIWDIERRVIEWEWEPHHAVIFSLAFSSDRTLLASAGNDNAVRLWDLQKRSPLFGEEAHRAPVTALAFSPDGNTLVSGGIDKNTFYWDVKTGKSLSKQQWEGEVLNYAFLPGDRALISEWNRFHMIDLKTKWEIQESVLEKGGSSFAVSRSGKFAVGTHETIEIRDTDTGEVKLRINDPEAQQAKAMAFSPDGSVLASVKGGRFISLWDTKNGKQLRQIKNYDEPYSSYISFSSDGNYLFVGGLYMTTWAVNSDHTLQYRALLRGGGLCTLSPDGKFLAARDPDNSNFVRLYKVRWDSHGPFEYYQTLKGHRGQVSALAFSPGGKILASGSVDSNVVLWDLQKVGGAQETTQAPQPQEERVLVDLRFEDKVEGIGVPPVHFESEGSIVQFIDGPKGRAARLLRGFPIPEVEDFPLGGSYTFQFWFRAQDLAAKHLYVLDSESVVFDLRDAGDPYVFIRFKNRGGHSSVSLKEKIGKIESQRWYHLAIVHDQSQNNVSVYVNGDRVYSGSPGSYVADRIGKVDLGDKTFDRTSIAVDVDELQVFNYPRTPEQIAKESGNKSPKDLAKPQTPSQQITQTSDIEKIALQKFTVYRLGGALANTQILSLDVDDRNVWVGTSRGLLRYNQTADTWSHVGTEKNLPGPRIDNLAAGEEGIAMDLSTESKPGYTYAQGTYVADGSTMYCRKVKDGNSWELRWEGKNLWRATSNGVEVMDVGSGESKVYNTSNGLGHNTVHDFRFFGPFVWFATMGDYVKDTDSFVDGGISRLDRTSGEWRNYSVKHGLAYGYCSALALDKKEVWVAHWDEERGVSVLDLKTDRWKVLKKSANGIELGGVVLALDNDYVWMGQQRALVRLDRKTLQAIEYMERDGLPGYIVSGIAISKDAVWVTAYSYGGEGVRSSGIVRLPRGN